MALLTSRLERDEVFARRAARMEALVAELRERTGILHQVEAARARADVLTQETQALAYESAQYLVEDLWHMAVQPRRRVLALLGDDDGPRRLGRIARRRLPRSSGVS